MLERDFTEEQQMFREAYRQFLAEEVVPHMETWREAGIVDREIFRKAGDQGFLMVWPDEKYGGTGDPATTAATMASPEVPAYGGRPQRTS